MAFVVVLQNDWVSGRDPVPYHSTDPDGCLDFDSSPAKPRSVLQEIERKTAEDCEHHVAYEVVVCRVSGA